MLFELQNVEMCVWDNDGPGDAGPGDAGPGDAGPGDAGGAKITLTPEQNAYVNNLIAAEKRKVQAKLQETTTQMEAILANQKLTADERSNLQTAVDTLNQQLKTKEELAKQSLAKAQKEATEALERERAARQAAEAKFHNEIITRSLTDAAVMEKAYNPGQIVSLLKDRTKLVDDKPVVEVPAKNDTGEVVTLLLAPSEALARMRENPDNFNLFQTTLKNGVGGTSGGASPTGDVRSMTPEQYMKARRANRFAPLPGMKR